MKHTPYLIRAVRLINFHNFTNETITLEGGGHLFLLGDNGCGKTTILDAVHYALTAGLAMEWNSAARMSGSKRDGRRVQGIVLRYNLDTGIMNRNGAITYVALEIIGRQGKPLTIGVGISATALDERIGFWGVIRECPLAEISFLVEEDGRQRPASRREFKQQLGTRRGFFNNQAGYRREIGERLFGGGETYRDICRFLAMGKAYREISAGAADYHALFKKLLPEPRTAIFEQIIEALRTLDESQAILDDLDRKLLWLGGLQVIITTIAEQRQAMLRYDWLDCRFSLKKIRGERTEVTGRIATGEEQLLRDEEELAVLARKERELEKRLETLKARDGSGLILQEKQCQDELDDKKGILERETRELHKQRVRLRKCEKESERLRTQLEKMLAGFLPALAARAVHLPFSVSRLQAELDQLSRSEDVFAEPEVTAGECITLCDAHLQTAVQDAAVFKQQQTACLDDIKEQEEVLQELERQSDFFPNLDNYQHCLRRMRESVLNPRPLYLGLEWSTAVKQKERQYIEECIGEENLAIILFREAEYVQAREIVVDYPGLRISSTGRIAEALPDWMRRVFDIQASDPDCLRCLAVEMESSGLQPQVSLVHGKPLAAFRSHERRLHGHSAGLIGEESRKKALAAEIRKVKETLRSLNHDSREIKKKLQTLLREQEQLSTFKSFLLEQTATLQRQAREGARAEQERIHCQELFEQQHGRVVLGKQEVDGLKLRQKELAQRIAGEGLANLERRIRTLNNKKAANRQATDTLVEKTGADKHAIQQFKLQLQQLSAELISFEEQKTATEEQLRQIVPDIDDLDHYILKTRKGQQFRTRDAVRKERERSRDAALTGAVQIKEKLNDPEFGGGFRFAYDEDDNELLDFRQQPLSLIIDQQSTALAEQKEVINERTRELFKKIIMTDLMRYLRAHVGELDQMIRRINTLLKERSFGGQRYRFRIRPLDQFQHLITIIKKISPFDPTAEKELETFFDDHREAIIATEAGSIPEELDYRNWFRYQMQVSTISDQGVVMDRKNKSIGSGGEQAVPNYLLILTIAHFLYRGKKTKIHTLLFDEAFYGIDAGRRDQILGFATDLGLQLFIASPDQDGVRREVQNSTTLLVKKDRNFDVHLYPFHWQNPQGRQIDLFAGPEKPVAFDEEL